MKKVANKQKAQQYKDERGILVFSSPTLIDFDYKYLTMGTIEPKAKRGGHYHTRIEEKFLCLSGALDLYLERDGSTEHVTLYPGDIADIPKHYKHTVLNKGPDVGVFVEFKSEEFDPNDKDVYTE